MIQMLILMLIVFQIGCAQNQLSNDSGDTGGRAKYFEQNAVGIAASIYYHQEKFAGRPTKEIVEDYIYSYKKSYDDYVTSKKAFGEATNIYQKYETELSKLVWNSNQKYTYIASLDLRDTYDPSQRGYLLKNDSMQWINAPYR